MIDPWPLVLVGTGCAGCIIVPPRGPVMIVAWLAYLAIAAVGVCWIAAGGLAL